MKIDLSLVHASKLLIRRPKILNISLVGCGGTGSWLASSVVRIAKVLQETSNTEVNVTFIDPDHVEEKNVFRQNFCFAEAHQSVNKAQTLAFRYGTAWQVDVKAIPEVFDDSHLAWSGTNIIIGAVDNALARQSIDSAVRHHDRRDIWWLDCGNHSNAGQILLGGGDDEKDTFSLSGYCTALPLPSEQHPELLVESDSPDNPIVSGLSCAALALVDFQSLSINQSVAAAASDFLVRMLITRDLTRFATYLSLRAGNQKSSYITIDTVRKATKNKE